MSLIKVKGSSITGALAAVDGSALTGISAGITEADQWRITSNFSGDAVPIASNWERNDTDFSKIGTGLTESSGIFSFPSTGIYLVMAEWVGYYNGDSKYNDNLRLSEKVGIDGNIVDNPVTELPSEAEVNAKLKELQDEWDSNNA
jgi:hypothetical protein